MNKPTILHVITGLGDGGAEAVLFRLCSTDTSYRHHVVSLMDGGKYGPMLEARGIMVTSLGMQRGKVNLIGAIRLWRLIREEKPQAVQTWMHHANLLGGIIARLAGKRNIAWGIHNTTLIPDESKRSIVTVSRLCACISHWVPHKIICCADAAREAHAELGYDRKRMVVIPNGYDLSVFQPDTKAGQKLREELELEDKEPLIGFVARYDPQKDHLNLLDALAILENQNACPHCLLVGTGTEATNIQLVEKILSRGLQERITLIGRRNDIPAVMNALDFHVMSSSFGEAFPNVLAEAMACGTPCVCTDVGDAASIVGATGKIVPPRNSVALAAAIADFLAELNTGSWANRCDSARRRVSDNYSIQRMLFSYQNVWVADNEGIM